MPFATSRSPRFESLEPRDLLHAGHVESDPPALPIDTASDAPIVVAALTPQSLLPDLIPWASVSEGFIYDWTIQGNDLRLTTAAANIGTGRMELRGGTTHGDTQDVYQRIFEPNGSFTDVLAGTFTFHPEHGHIHFEGFSEYRLRTVLPDGGVGPIVASGDKVSFCLLDVERYDSSGPLFPHFLTCGQVQGISVGWADVYDRGLPGQSIDITGVPDGDYWLEVAVDPDNHLIESNEDNNVVRIQINLQRPSGGGAILPDVFEANDSLATASILAPPEDHVYYDLNIHASRNSDYYRVTASVSGTMAFRLAFQDSQGDVDMEVFDASQTRIGRSTSTSNNEQVSFAAVAGQYYYVRVYGYDGAMNPNYTLSVDQPEDASGVRYLSTTGGGSLSSTDGSPPLGFDDSDILQLAVQSNGQYGYQLHFDGSDVGLTTSNEDIDAFTFLPDESILISTVGSFSVPAPGGGSLTGSGQDLLRFIPTTLGATTSGTWSMYFDGSDVGLGSSSENIDAVAVLSSGVILLSTTGDFSVSGASGRDEDLVAFSPTQLGATTAGSWAIYFDGSDVGIGSNDINGLYVRETSGNPTLFLSLVDSFSISGTSGANEDAVAFAPTSLGTNTAGTFGPGLALDGSLYGLSSFNVDGIHLVPPAIPLAASAQSAAVRAAFATYEPAPVRLAASAIPTTPTAVVSTSVLASSTLPPTSTCGCRRPIETPATTTSENEHVTLWDFVAESLGEIFRGIYWG